MKDIMFIYLHIVGPLTRNVLYMLVLLHHSCVELDIVKFITHYGKLTTITLAKLYITHRIYTHTCTYKNIHIIY